MKKRIIILLIFFILLVVGFLIFIFPKIQEKMDFQKLEKRVAYVNLVFASDKKMKEVTSEFEKTDTHLEKLEGGINQYFTDLLKIYNTSSEILKKDFIKNPFTLKELESSEMIQNRIDLLKKEKQHLETSISKLKDFELVDKRKAYIDSSNLESFQLLLKKFDYRLLKKYIEKVNISLEDLNKDISLLEYLNNSFDTWHVAEDKVEFLKRFHFDEFSSLPKSNNISNMTFQLVNDLDGPIITVNDITIYVNNKVDLGEKVSCVDEVDGEVECQIDGSYDSGKVGTYPITVTSVDKNNNKSEKTFQVKVIAKVSSKPYLIHVLRNQNVVIIYGLDDNGEYTKVVKVFVCSTGKNNATPVGTFSTTKGATWGSLYGGVWGQYTTRIVSDILFHSVPYFSRDKSNLEWEEYNKLGTQASLGCVRLTVRDAKWIFYNCPVGTTVKIYDGDLPSGISKPSALTIDGSSPNRGWDPTDDDSNNPW